MKKTFILDTNILMSDEKAPLGFEDNKVVITGTSLQELDSLKVAHGDTGYSARRAIKFISTLKDHKEVVHGNVSTGFETKAGGMIIFEPDNVDERLLPVGFDGNKADNRIISVALSYQRMHEHVILVTNDAAMQISANICGVEAQGYKNLQIQSKTEYTGRKEILILDKAMDKLYKEHMLLSDDVSCEIEDDTVFNQFITFKSLSGSSALAMYEYDKTLGKWLFKLINTNENRENPYMISGRNAAQRFAIHALTAPANAIPLVVLKGMAGCGKTILAEAAGLDGVHDGLYKKMMITRANVLSDADQGFLPGTLEEKMSPLIAPFIDNLRVILGQDEEEEEQVQIQIEDLLSFRTVEIAAIAYMRGRSLSNTYLIVDEAQNATPNQILEIVSRAGAGTKVVICGDVDQIDNTKLDRYSNGLSFVAERMKGSKLCAQITFDSTECVRSPLANEAIERLTRR